MGNDSQGPPEPQQSSGGVSPSLLWLNAFVLALEGLALSIWLIYYTSIFPEVAGLLALGGASAWLFVVWQVLSERRQNELQMWTETRVLNSGSTLAILSICGFALVVVGSLTGGIQLEPFQESLEHTVVVTVDGGAPSEPLHLLPGGLVRWTAWTCWWSRTKISIKVSGYPEKEVEVRPWQRVPVYVPSSLLRPVVLVHPSVPLIDAIRDTSMTLQVRITETNNPAVTVDETALFDGHAIWIGGDDDILVPMETETKWREDLRSTKSMNHLSFWLPPVAPPKFKIALHAGQAVKLVLRKSNNDVYEELNFKVRPLRSSRDFIQEVELDVPAAIS